MKGTMKASESMGSVIRRLRMERGWTQEALAERISDTSQAVSKWETEQSLRISPRCPFWPGPSALLRRAPE